MALSIQILPRARSSPAPSSTQSTPTSSPSRSPIKTMSLTNIISKMRQSPTRPKPNHIECSSGPPNTHPMITLNAYEKSGPYELKETYICSDAVDMHLLLRLTRNLLLETICNDELNTLVDERWKYTICCRKNRNSSIFRIQVSYVACCAQSVTPDPHQPVALDKIRNVPGLMTIRQRTH